MSRPLIHYFLSCVFEGTFNCQFVETCTRANTHADARRWLHLLTGCEQAVCTHSSDKILEDSNLFAGFSSVNNTEVFSLRVRAHFHMKRTRWI